MSRTLHRRRRRYRGPKFADVPIGAIVTVDYGWSKRAVLKVGASSGMPLARSGAEYHKHGDVLPEVVQVPRRARIHGSYTRPRLICEWSVRVEDAEVSSGADPCPTCGAPREVGCWCQSDDDPEFDCPRCGAEGAGPDLCADCDDADGGS